MRPPCSPARGAGWCPLSGAACRRLSGRARARRRPRGNYAWRAGFAALPERRRVGLVFHRPARCGVIQGAPACPRGAARYDALASSQCVGALRLATFAGLRPLLVRLADYRPGFQQRLRIRARGIPSEEQTCDEVGRPVGK